MSWQIETAFLDRDGTINADHPTGGYNANWDDITFLPRAKEAIRLLNDLGLRVFVVTNQRGVALGRMTAEDVEEIHRRMALELAGAGATVDRFYYCTPEVDSDCGDVTQRCDPLPRILEEAPGRVIDRPGAEKGV